MSKTLLRFSAICWLMLVAISFVAPSYGQKSEGLQDALKNFQGLDKDYAPAPLWTWNDMMTEEGIRRHLKELDEQGVQQVFVHPRPSLMTTYLTDEWFQMWGAALKAAEELDMNIWIYDENSYPSGFAGGHVHDQMPESQDQGLMIERKNKRPEMTEDIKAVYLLDEKDQPRLVTEQAKKKETPEKGKYLVVTRVWGPSRDWYAGKHYVDLLKPGVTEKFLEITLDAYKKHFGDQFGKRIPGSFTDEPRMSTRGNVHWNDQLPELFEKKWGYPLTENLSQLVYATGDWRRTRHNFYSLLNDLFVENWAMKYADYCEKNGLEFTGHVWEHSWPTCRNVPDNMAFSACQHRPGIDMLCYDYKQDSTTAQFGNVRSVKEIASVANQTGRKRTICEIYGASGWWMSFADYKCYADWNMVLGINTIDEHYTSTTLRGARKYDYPPHFSYQASWWKDYHVLAEYYTRVCGAISSGQQINPVLVLEPTTTMWMYQGHDSKEKRYDYANQFQKLVTDMELAQAEFDLLSEDVLKRNGQKGTPGKLTVGRRAYDLFIIPQHTENLDSETVAYLKDYLATGGKVLCCGEVPFFIDGKETDEIKKLATSPNWKQVTPEEAVQAAIDRTAQSGLAIKRAKDDQGILFHHRRQMDDGQLVFLVNTSTEHPTAATLTADGARSVQAWDPFSGKVYMYPATSDGKTLTAQVEIPPCGSLLLSFSKKGAHSAPMASTNPMIPLPGPDFAHSKSLPTVGPLTAKRLAPNELTLDFADISAGGETKEGMALIDAQDWVFKQHGFKKNPWRHAVQWKDELRKHKYAADSGFTVTYRFAIEGDKIPTPLEIVIERADLYQITCNGKTVTPTPKKWWLDRSFGVVDISKTAKVGPNEVTIAMKPMTMYGEVANAYLIGDFTLEPAAKGFKVKADHPLAVPTADNDIEEAKAKLSWKAQGLPFYAEEVAYKQTFNVPAADKADAKKRYFVELPSWTGSLARVSVNGKPAGHIIADPWRCEVTSLITPGDNVVEVEIVGTRMNTLGPHHYKERPVWTGPYNFGGCPFGPPAGKDYKFEDYGLWKPIQLNVVW